MTRIAVELNDTGLQVARDGTGGEQGAWCNYCGAAGWLCPADFQRRVDAVKATSGKRGAR